jgi:hypothetical protein
MSGHDAALNLSTGVSAMRSLPESIADGMDEIKMATPRISWRGDTSGFRMHVDSA